MLMGWCGAGYLSKKERQRLKAGGAAKVVLCCISCVGLQREIVDVVCAQTQTDTTPSAPPEATEAHEQTEAQVCVCEET